MIFSPNQQFSDSDINMVKVLLEKLIDKPSDYCRKKVEDHGFIYLDYWDKKMGFVKEEQNKYLILSLHFEENKCHFYQLIIKEANKKWSEGRILDYNVVRDLGIID